MMKCWMDSRRKEDCQMVRLQDKHLQCYYRALAHASWSWALTKMKVHLPLDLDKLELEHLIITMAISNGEDWAKRTRLDKMESTDDTVENTEKNCTKWAACAWIMFHKLCTYRERCIEWTRKWVISRICHCAFNDRFPRTTVVHMMTYVRIRTMPRTLNRVTDYGDDWTSTYSDNLMAMSMRRNFQSLPW